MQTDFVFENYKSNFFSKQGFLALFFIISSPSNLEICVLGFHMMNTLIHLLAMIKLYCITTIAENEKKSYSLGIKTENFLPLIYILADDHNCLYQAQLLLYWVSLLLPVPKYLMSDQDFENVNYYQIQLKIRLHKNCLHAKYLSQLR